MGLTEAELSGWERIHGDLPYFALNFLKIRNKSGKLEPLKFNRAQKYLHERLEEQLDTLGMVRALSLKGRQQGISTYTAARFFHKTSLNEGKRAFIMAHEQKASNNLFGMVKRYHENLDPLIQPRLDASNAQELAFADLDSGYKVVTAGTKETGRSATSQYLHASEVAFWANASQHLAGIGNTVADIEGTEIILESTGNGVGGGFHGMWQKAEIGEGVYIPVFVPWYWQDEYRSPVLPSLELTPEEIEYQEAFGLDMEQMQWRANKIATYESGFEWLFDQEYPAVPELAFQSPTKNPLINPALVQKAVKSGYMTRLGAHVIGCDPAEGINRDRTAIVFRHGRVVYRCEAHTDLDLMEAAGLLATYWNQYKPDAIIVDRVGIGAGVVSRLRELHIPVIGVHSGERAREHDLYVNKRAEMWWEMLAWFKDTPCRIPNDTGLIADLSAPAIKYHSSSRKCLEGKDQMAARDIRSPDLGDALALTFAEPVQPRQYDPIEIINAARQTSAPTSAGY